MRSTLSALLLTLALTSLPAAFAQIAKTPARKTAPSSPASSLATAASSPATGAQPCLPTAMHVQPYTAKQQVTRVQTLADGSTVRTVDVILLARDAEGRTRRETVRTQNGDLVHTFQIFDFVTQTRYTWNTGNNYPQVVNVYQSRPNPQPALPTYQAQRYYPYRSESLPPQTISGVYTEGSRYIRTTPIGYVGNDRDLVTTTESWYAPALSLQMRSTIDDPRAGKTTTETTDINQADPDPALFQPPAGFTLKETNP